MEPLACKPIMSLRFRDRVRPEDADIVYSIVASTGFFSRDEEFMAASLVTERIERGPECGYQFLFAENAEKDGGVVLGYTCFGPISCTAGRFDLYWIAVAEEFRGLGIGRELLAATEHRIRFQGGARIYAETSSRDQYTPTRAFYEHTGFRKEAVLPDYYAPGDDNVFYAKDLPPLHSER
ncbi:MAG: N-acetyltransferase family protein [Desulfovibrionaceae bacterium]